jgi:serine/threonine protein kinase
MGRCDIVRLIGSGGMGQVYEARYAFGDHVKVAVACKQLRPDLKVIEGMKERFEQEAILGFTIGSNHPGLVAVHGLERDTDGNLCIIMEYVDGCSLRDLMRSGHEIPSSITRLIVRELLLALLYLHEQDIVHRDISPCNVLLSVQGAVKLSDLGLAKVMLDGRGKSSSCFLGKAPYASAAQLRGETAAPGFDLHAVGAMLYELLSGTPPFGQGSTPLQVLERMEHRPPALDERLPRDLRELALALLAGTRDQGSPRTAEQGLSLLDSFRYPVASRAELGTVIARIREEHLLTQALGNERIPRLASKHANDDVGKGSELIPTGPLKTEVSTRGGRMWRGATITFGAGFIALLLVQAASFQRFRRDHARPTGGFETEAMICESIPEPSTPAALAEGPRASWAHDLEVREHDSTAREGSAGTADEPRSGAAARTRKRRHTWRNPAGVASPKEPKNVAPLASIPK